jgi:hypothetical protein
MLTVSSRIAAPLTASSTPMILLDAPAADNLPR